MADESTALGMPKDVFWGSRGEDRKWREQNTWNSIDWGRIGRAVHFYQQRGYLSAEVPWVVDPKFCAATYPHTRTFTTEHGDLVGSAEQSFLALAAAGVLDMRKAYVGVSPCFRDNQPNDRFHNPYFLKVELYHPEPRYKTRLSACAYDAAEFFRSEGAFPEFEETDEGWDINVGGIEVGSYGNREVYDHFWTYGTGLAEPRFSQALHLQERYVRDRIDGPESL